MNEISSEDIDKFIEELSKKPCKGSKSYHKNPEDIPTLSSGSVKKCYNILTAGFPVAKRWGYIDDIPDSTAPVEKNAKRKAWEPKVCNEHISIIKGNGNNEGDKLLHLAARLAFNCSLRAGEAAGIEIKTVNLEENSLWITQEVQRVSDEAINNLPKTEVFYVFPKQIADSKSSLILKAPKNERSHRKLYYNATLAEDIKVRLEQIEKNKYFYGEEYQDYGLLICQPDGRPIESKKFGKWFKQWQGANNISDQLDFQGLRKTGQMHKVRLTNNNFQLVAENGGQTEPVLHSNYNEVLDYEKRQLAELIEQDLHSDGKVENEFLIETLQDSVKKNPDLFGQLVQLLLPKALAAQQV